MYKLFVSFAPDNTKFGKCELFKGLPHNDNDNEFV